MAVVSIGGSDLALHSDPTCVDAIGTDLLSGRMMSMVTAKSEVMLLLSFTVEECLLVDFVADETCAEVWFDMDSGVMSDFVVPGKNRASKEAMTGDECYYNSLNKRK